MMKLFEKLFPADAPAGNKFAKLTLILALLWIVPGILLFFAVMPMPELAVQIVLLAAMLLLIPYDLDPAAEQSPKNKWKPAVKLLFILLLGALFVPKLSFVWTAAGLLAVSLLAFPFSSCRKLFFARWACVGAAVGCFIAAQEAARAPAGSLFNPDPIFNESKSLIDPDCFPALVIAGIVLFAAGYLLTAMEHARTARIPLGKVFSPACRIVLGIWAVFYLLSLGFALTAEHRTEKTVAVLEQMFGRPLTAQGLKAMYLRDRKPDAAFWAKVESCIERITPTGTPIGPVHMIAGTPEGVYPKETLAEFKNYFDRLEPVRELEKLFGGKVPAMDHRMESGQLFNIRLRELNWCRDFCRKELWRIRFSLENNDLPSARAALVRMKNTADYLGEGSPMLICNLVMFACESYRMRGLELLLADGRVPDAELEQWIAGLERDEKALAAIAHEAKYAETTLINDFIDSTFTGRVVLPNGNKASLRLYPLRWLYPPLWEYFELDRLEILDYMGQKWDAPHPPGRRIMSTLWRPAVKIWSNRFLDQAARYRAMRALIRIELEKRRTGKYPDTVSGLPPDPFTGKPMRYRKGAIPVTEPVWDAAKKRFEENKVRAAEGIAVW
ncbi:MAG: hypothetical protein IJS14_02470, partial [Lentisphaeria bacterium]|nr:hypothetical protein [Lentisphaeria bacterium]